ncbi:MAG: hypothetical protein ACI89L_000947 [Phycisphaerales bacterium]
MRHKSSSIRVALLLGAIAPSWLAGPLLAGPDTTSVNAFDTATMMSGDCRVVVLGDSFAETSFRFVFCAFLNVWEPTPLTAAYVPGGPRPRLGVVTPLASPYTDIAAESPTGYEALASTGSPEYITLPVRGVAEFEGGPGLTLGAGNGLMQYAVRNATLQHTPAGRMFTIGDRLGFRGLYWATPDTAMMHTSLGLAVGGATLDQFDPTTEARKLLRLGETPDGLGRAAVPGHFNAFARDLDFTVQQGNADGRVVLGAPTGAVDPGAFVHAAGGVYTTLDPQTGERLPGLYYSALADSSWSYRGFGVDLAPTFSLDKVFTESQLTQWLDVTTLDPQQPTVFVYYLAAEPDNGGDAPAKIEAMIDQSQASADAVGLTSVRHLLVMPHFHRIIGMADVVLTRERMEEQRDAMFEIASRRPEVSAVSIYDATGGVLLDGSATARDWLRANAPTPFQYANQAVDLADGPMLGDLLDASNLHPTNNDAGAFYAKALVDALLAPLALDFNRDGILDNGDINGFVAAFLAADPAADLNADGILDNGDISCFVTRFLAEI